MEHSPLTRRRTRWLENSSVVILKLSIVAHVWGLANLQREPEACKEIGQDHYGKRWSRSLDHVCRQLAHCAYPGRE